MSDHRIELHVSFTVNDGRDGGRWTANEILRQLNMFGTHLHGLTSDFEATPGTVDGIGWHEKWPTPVQRISVHDGMTVSRADLEDVGFELPPDASADAVYRLKMVNPS